MRNRLNLLKTAALFLLAPLVPLPAASAEDRELPLATTLVPKDFVVVGSRPAMGELWSARVSAPSEPTYCVRDGRVVCVLYGITKQGVDQNSSWANFYGIDGLPPVTDMRVEYEENWLGTAAPRFNIVLYFADPA